MMCCLSGVGISLSNISIEGCDLKGDDAVPAIIEVVDCPSPFIDPADIQLQYVDFIGNRNLGGSIAVAVQEPSCFRVEMQNVTFDSNLYTEASQLGLENQLRNVSLISNELSRRDRKSVV